VEVKNLMRKVFAIIIVVIVIAILGVAIGAAVNDDFKLSVGNTLTAVGGSVWIAAQNAWLQLVTISSANGTTFLVYTLIVLIAGGLFWVGFKALLWDNRPGWMGNKTTTSLPTVREEPRDIIITQSPVPTTQKEKEVTATESQATS
jgi:energy-converting hydrogenase Eha subunit E